MGKTYMKKCCVPNCFNVKQYNCFKTGEDNATYDYKFRLFRFPKDPKRRKIWLRLIGRPEMVIKTSSRICSHHFTKEDYYPDKNILMDDCRVGRKCLRGTAQPSKWLPENVDVGEVDEEDDGEEPCLICSGTVKGGKRKRFKFDGAEDLNLLNEQLWSTFILREVLKVGGDRFGGILELVGGSVQPGKWFRTCGDCEASVVKILGMRKAIRKLEEGIEEMEGILRRRLEESLAGEGEEEGNGGIGEILNVRREIRKGLKIKGRLSLDKVEIKKERVEEDKLDDNFNCDLDGFDEDLLSAEKSPKLMDDKEEEYNQNDSSEDSDYKPEVEDKQDDKKIFKPQKKRKSRAKIKPSCDLCNYKAWSPTKMERHIIEHRLFDNSIDPAISTTQFYCNLCPITPTPSLFLTRRHLMRHKRIKHPSQLNLPIYQCPQCPESFFFKASYSNHLFKKHPAHYQTTLIVSSQSADNLNPDPPPQSYLCDKCNYTTLFKHQFTRHLRDAHAPNSFICQYCSSTYKYSYSLQAHIKRFHPDQWTGPKRNIFVPSLNGDSSTSTVNLIQTAIKKAAKKKANTTTVVTCKYCSSEFPHKLALGLHLKTTHKDLFNWKCDLCDKSYLRRQSLQTHLKINHLESGVKGKCEWCGKEVQHKTYLFGHRKHCEKRPVDQDQEAV